MAKIALQLLEFASDISSDIRATAMTKVASLTADWIVSNVRRTENGWWPRYTLASAEWTPTDDFLFNTSSDALFLVSLICELVASGDDTHREVLISSCKAFVDAGGFFGTINHDTYNSQESVAYSVAFKTLLRVADVLGDESLRRFAYETPLSGLARFRMCEDRNGVATKGLLYMEDTWDTAYLWENAEAAHTYFEAAVDCPEFVRDYSNAGLTILRAAAKHHHGQDGFLTEGIDWNNHVGQEHHIDNAEFGAIRYTEPLLNNQHILSPTLFYLQYLAEKRISGDTTEYYDHDGNLLCSNRAT